MKLTQLVWQKGSSSPLLSPELAREWDSENTLVLVFFSPSLAGADAFWNELNQAFPRSRLAGCSDAGEVSGALLEDNKAIVTLCRFESSQVRVHSVRVEESSDSRSAGKRLAQLFPAPGLRGIFVLSEGLVINGTELVAGIQEGLSPDVQVSGGLAGDGTDFKRTFVIEDGRPISGAVTAVGFYGPRIRFASAAEGGWSPFGPERRITRSLANVVYEIDGKPALKLYREFLGDLAQRLPSSGLLFPMLIQKDQRNQRDIVRTLLGINEKEESLTFAGDMPQGASVQLMRSGARDLIQAATTSAEQCSEVCRFGAPTLSLVVSCVGRRLVLGERTEDELESIASLLPVGSVQTGFYSYGELAKGKGLYCDLHNQTMTLTWIQETDEGEAS